MALFTKEDEQPTSSSNTMNQSSTGNTVIGSTLQVEGTMKSSENITIHGVLKGSLQTSENVTVGDSGKVEADITCQAVVIAGAVTGNITAKGSVTLKAQATVTGDITAESIAIEPGATINGSIHTGGGVAKESATDKA